VSHYDGAVDWAAAHAAGIGFGIAKATEGTSLLDDQFSANWSGMSAAGVVRGAYHFFHPGSDAVAQANFVVDTVGALGAGDLPIVCDLEETDGLSQAEVVAHAITFLQTVSQLTGKTAILYASPGFLSSFGGLGAYPLWVANYEVSCPTVPAAWSSWQFWQSGDSGTVSGISSDVDVDVYNGTLAELRAFAGGGGAGGSGGPGGSGGGGNSGNGGNSGSGGSGKSGAGNGGSGGGGSGIACSSDGDCNPGSDGSGQVCVGGSCVAGCNADWECPGNTTCQGGNCQ
jgi:lysozyme